MKKRLACYALIICALSILVSCSSREPEVEQLAVKLVDSKMWSFIDVKTGEIIYEDEFKKRPSQVVNGIFYVQNAEGTYDFYNISEVKKPINKESYKEVTIFNEDGKALAVKQGGTIEVIDEKCKTIVNLGKEIASCSLFHNGTAVYESTTGMKGIINDKGEIVVKAKYDIVTNFSDDDLAIVGTKEKDELIKYYVIDKKEKVQFSFSSKDYDEYLQFNEGVLPVRKADGSKDIIFLDVHGKKIAKFGTDNTGWSLYTYGMNNGITSFKEGDLYGIKDAEANILIRAKYDRLSICNKDVIVVEKEGKVGVINVKDETIISFDHENIFSLSNDRFIAGSSKSASLIDSEGKDIGTANFKDVSLGGNQSVNSNYYNAVADVKKIMSFIDDKSCHNIKAGQTLSSFSRLLTFSEYHYKDESALTEEDGDISFFYGFNKNISHETYKYLYGYKLYDGVKFDYSAQCVAVAMMHSVKDYDITAEEQFVKEFEKQLKASGYVACKDKHYFKNKNGYCVAAGYSNGNIVIWYMFRDYNLVSIGREARTKVDITDDSEDSDDHDEEEDSADTE